jgi:predicted PurR-regulated permease PerM
MSISRISLVVFLVLLFFTSYLMAELFLTFVTPIVLALILISIFNPPYWRMLSACRGNKHIAAFIVTLGIVLLVSIPVSFFLTSLSQQAFIYYQTTQSSTFLGNLLPHLSSEHPLVEKIRNMATIFGIDISTENILNSMKHIVSSFGLVVYKNLSQLASNAFSIVFNFVITMVLVYTFFVTGSDLKKYLMDLSPLPVDEKECLVKQFSEISRAVFVSNGVVSIAEGIFGGLGFYLFGLGPAFFWGVVIAFSAFLPVVGAFMVVIPAAFVLAAQGDVSLAIAYFVYNSCYLGVLELVVKPNLIGGKNRLNMVFVLLSVLGGIQIFGVLGIFYGPLVATMFLSLIEIYKDHYREHLLNLDKP